MAKEFKWSKDPAGRVAKCVALIGLLKHTTEEQITTPGFRFPTNEIMKTTLSTMDWFFEHYCGVRGVVPNDIHFKEFRGKFKHRIYYMFHDHITKKKGRSPEHPTRSPSLRNLFPLVEEVLKHPIKRTMTQEDVVALCKKADKKPKKVKSSLKSSKIFQTPYTSAPLFDSQTKQDRLGQHLSLQTDRKSLLLHQTTEGANKWRASSGWSDVALTVDWKEEFKQALQFLFEGKRQFSPNTTNSHVDRFLEKHHDLLVGKI